MYINNDLDKYNDFTLGDKLYIVHCAVFLWL